MREIGQMDYHNAKAAIAAGRTAVNDALPAIRRYL